MGTFYIGCRIENHTDRARTIRIPKLLVDTGSEYTWVPAATLQKIGVVREKKDLSFVLANGQIVTRSVGFAIVRVGSSFTIDEVVFAEPGDLALLARSTDPRRSQPDGRFRAEEARRRRAIARRVRRKEKEICVCSPSTSKPR